jgi:hypothetical protein
MADFAATQRGRCSSETSRRRPIASDGRHDRGRRGRRSRAPAGDDAPAETMVSRAMPSGDDGLCVTSTIDLGEIDPLTMPSPIHSMLIELGAEREAPPTCVYTFHWCGEWRIGTAWHILGQVPPLGFFNWITFSAQRAGSECISLPMPNGVNQHWRHCHF